MLAGSILLQASKRVASMETRQSKGGLARANALSSEKRSEIARKAAEARWLSQREAIREGILNIGDIEIQCYVLEDETRVLTQASFLEAIGRHRKARVRRMGGEDQVPAILYGKGIKPFISKETLEKTQPVVFRLPSGTKAYGFRAELLPAVCEVYLAARDAGALPANQKHVAERAYLLMRALAHVGIIALVDEATGYQRDRAADALARILERFIAKELRPWVRTFPDAFYEQLFRLRGLEFPGDRVQRPQYFGHLTNDIIYRRLAPGVLQELQSVTPKDSRGRKKHQMFRRLSEDVGHPKLREHLASVVTIMKLSTDYDDFIQKLDGIHPRFNETMALDFQPEGETKLGL